MTSLLVQYDGKELTTRTFPGRFRGLAWDGQGSRLVLVGNGGRVLSIEESKEVALVTETKHNLRAVSINPVNNTVLAVGNSGTIIASTSDGSLLSPKAPTSENLRAVRWNEEGTSALIVGNNGAVVRFGKKQLDLIDGARANLRGIAWRKDSNQAIVSSNCFAEEFIPSPNLFVFDAIRDELKPVSEGRIDLIGVDWNPIGRFAIVVGYDVVWHNGFLARFDGTEISPIQFENERVYPVAVRWDPAGREAAIATSIAQLHSGEGRLILWNGGSFREIYRSHEFFFSQVAWAPIGWKLAAIASSESRTFDT